MCGARILPICLGLRGSCILRGATTKSCWRGQRITSSSYSTWFGPLDRRAQVNLCNLLRSETPPRRVPFPASIFQVSALSIVPALKCSSFCGKVFRFTPALRSSRSCCIGTAKQILKLMCEWSSRLAFLGRSGDAELLHSATERVRMEDEDFRCALGTVNNPTRLLKSGQDMVPCVGFQAFERRSLSHTDRSQTLVFGTGLPCRISARRAICRCGGEHFRIDLQCRTVRQNDRPFQNILQFANVSWPPIAAQSLQGRLSDRLDAHADAGREPGHQKMYQYMSLRLWRRSALNTFTSSLTSTCWDCC